MKITAYLFLALFLVMLNFMFVPDLISDNDSSLTMLGISIIIAEVGILLTIVIKQLKELKK